MTSRGPLRHVRGARGLGPALSLAAALTGCASVPSQPADPAPSTPSRLGTVTATRPEVYVNWQPVRGTVPLNDGDKVATNATGRARVELADHDTVDLEENTDPWFIREGACVMVRILFGAAFASGRRLCVEDEQGNRVTLNSAVHVEVSRGRTTITAVEGSVQVRPAGEETSTTLTQSQRIAIMHGRILQRIIVPPIQLYILRQRFPHTPRPPRPPIPPR